MNELIKITEHQGKKVVSARELYLALGYANGQYSRWAKSSILDNPYAIENEDYVGFDINVEGNQTKDYALSISFAKKIAMTAKTEVGNKIRDYFIECEKKLKEVSSNVILMPNFTDPAEAAIAWAEQYRAKELAQIEAKNVKQHVKRLIHDNKTYTSGEIAKELNLKSANELNKTLEEKHIQFKQNGCWLLYAKYSDLGYTSIKQTELDNGKIVYDRRWSGKGRDFIINLLTDSL